MGVIYAIHKGDHDYRYVGQTRTDLQVRMAAHFGHAKKINKTPIHKFINKYKDTIMVDVIEEGIPFELLNDREVRWIKVLKEKGYRLLNCTEGGSAGTTLSEETRRKMSESAKKQKLSPEHYNALRTAQLEWARSEEGREFARQRILAGKNPNFGKPWDEELRRKTLESRKKNYKFTDQIVRDIRRRFAEGERGVDLAEEYGTDKHYISAIVRRKRRADVE